MDDSFASFGSDVRCIYYSDSEEMESETDEVNICTDLLNTEKYEMSTENLDERLSLLFDCVVCLSLPLDTVFQCQMGHLICNDCYIHLKADAKLQDKSACCPKCHSVNLGNFRNTMVELAVLELMVECQYCSLKLVRKALPSHEKLECLQRPVSCKFVGIGCDWKGIAIDAISHEQHCKQAHKAAVEVMEYIEQNTTEEIQLKESLESFLQVLNQQKIVFKDFKIYPVFHRSDDHLFITYDSPSFAAFGLIWIIKLRVNDGNTKVHQQLNRTLSYQLILKKVTQTPISFVFAIVKGPKSDMKVDFLPYKYTFTNQNSCSDFNLIPLSDSLECNRWLGSKTINFTMLISLEKNEKAALSEFDV